jgi:hypothetical protein
MVKYTQNFVVKYQWLVGLDVLTESNLILLEILVGVTLWSWSEN